jgi:hypothetical protein
MASLQGLKIFSGKFLPYVFLDPEANKFISSHLGCDFDRYFSPSTSEPDSSPVRLTIRFIIYRDTTFWRTLVSSISLSSLSFFFEPRLFPVSL